MKLKSMILASAASLFAVNGAVAADAIVAVDPEPVDYVQICDAYGAGFFFIPGTEVCLDISGRVRSQYSYTNDAGAGRDGINQDVDYRIDFDARHETDLGTVRAFVRIGEQGYVVGLADFNPQVGPIPAGVTPENAFIQVIGANGVTFTTGLAPSLYDGDGNLTTQIAFASGGFSGAIAYEDETTVSSALGGTDDAITANLAYTVDAFTISGELAYELEAGNTFAWNVGAAYSADRFGIALNYERFSGGAANTFESVGRGNDELSIDLDLTLTDKLSASSDWDVYFNARGWGVQNTLAYAVSSNFSIEAEFDYISNDQISVDNDAWALGLDFIATF
ncbi:MAG: porin [Pseudomonadota bacterium]